MGEYQVESPPGTKRHKPRILIVEDNVISQKLLARITSSYGEVAIAENGVEAMELHCNNPFDLILMDCNLPVMDGWEVSSTRKS